MSVDVTNRSRPTRCAEEDNVTVTLAGRLVGAFAITATHPLYAGTLAEDSTAPDFQSCDFTADPAFAFSPRTAVLYDGESWRLVGHAFARNWRPTTPLVRIIHDGGAPTIEPGLHLLQLFSKQVSPPIEFLVLYPADGYWRVKPLPPARLADSAYGSSFLIGPVEEDGRPLVRLDAITFEPARNRFHLAFTAGGEAHLNVAALTPERAVLDVALSLPAAISRPFAALRSMFVSVDNADVAEVGWRVSAADPWRTAAILAFAQAEAVDVRFRRSRYSRHNSSAPDLTFGRFEPASD